MRLRTLIFIGLALSFSPCCAQVDSLNVLRSDSIGIRNNGRRVVTIDTYAERFDPRKALLYSAILPGAGQAYNQRYWKIPIVYGGFAVGVYTVNFYQKIYFKYKVELFDLLNDQSVGSTGLSISGYNEEQLRRIINVSRRQRDYWVILNGVWYLLQMVEAHVDAHLKEFDLNPQLQVSIEPYSENLAHIGQMNGVALNIRF